MVESDTLERYRQELRGKPPLVDSPPEPGRHSSAADNIKGQQHDAVDLWLDAQEVLTIFYHTVEGIHRSPHAVIIRCNTHTIALEGRGMMRLGESLKLRTVRDVMPEALSPTEAWAVNRMHVLPREAACSLDESKHLVVGKGE